MKRTFQHSVCCVVLLSACWGGPIRAEALLPMESTLVVGREWTAVRALYRVPLLIGKQQLILDGIPVDADLGSLLVRDQRVSLQIQRIEWTAYAESVPSLTEKAPASFILNREAVYPMPAAPKRVAILLESPVRAERTLEVIYLTRGLTWSAGYQLRARGDLRRTEDERFSVDLSGFVEIGNASGQPFAQARLYVTGAEAPKSNPVLNDPGFLALSDSPLADLWKENGLPEIPESLYPIQGIHDLPADGRLSIPILDVLRIPAERHYVMDSSVVPLAAKGAGTPLHEVLYFGNTRRNGLGHPLPAGPVLVHRAGALQYRMTTARMSHAGLHDTVRIDMGPDAEVLGYRSRVDRTEGALKTFVERYAIHLVNNKEQNIQVIIRESPQTVLEWSVSRSGESYTRRGSTLEMRTTVAARREKVIEYTLHIKQPAF
ncbi:MAG: hypothetical protein PHP44_04200 [Kiritimatiellae bacterium]|nr:hypothetical protein [Kiritimatiellia bacterium]